MTNLSIKNLFETVKDGNKDSAVGIGLAHLSGTDNFSLFCTMMKPGHRVAAHYHEHGVEFYQVVDSKGFELFFAYTIKWHWSKSDIAYGRDGLKRRSIENSI